tara:strand:+ start:408 stop:638 length:231 start_codon:yes stop_codon:yes gene_type:complete
MSAAKKVNSGDTQTQIESFTEKINVINKHLKTNRKDHSSRRGLLMMVSRRKRLLKYLERRDLDGYKKLTEKLKIRK